MPAISKSVDTSRTGFRSITQIITTQLREEILDGVFEPGDRLHIGEMAERYSVSAVPVREALRSLESEGLVRFAPNKGAFVRELSSEEVQELVFIRYPMEVMAALAAIRWVTLEDLEKLEDILQRMDESPAAWMSLHSQFHRALSAISSMPRLTEWIDLMRSQMLPYSRMYAEDQTHRELAQKEHYGLVGALRDHDDDAVRTILHEHLARPARIVLDHLGITTTHVLQPVYVGWDRELGYCNPELFSTGD